MGADLMDAIATLLVQTEILLSKIKYPGTSWSIWGIMIFSAVIATVFSILRMLFFLPAAGGSYGKGGNNKDIKVDEKRKDDTK